MQRAYLYIGLIVITCAFFSALHSQTTEPKFDRLEPIAGPNCVLQDKFGFIWIGAQEGLIKYDGVNYKRFTNMPFDSTSLSSNWVSVLKEDKRGNLWVGTWSGGLNYFDQRTEKFTYYKGNKENHIDISKSNISGIIVNEDGSLWAGTKDQGLFYISSDSSGNKSYKKYKLNSVSDSLSNSEDISILCLYKDRNNKLWIGTSNKGLKCLNPKTGELLHFERDIHNPASISSNTVSSICEDDSGNLWIGTGYWMNQHGNGRGLNKFNLKSQKFSHFEHSLKDPFTICGNNISSVIIDQQNIMWIGTVENNICSIPVSELLNSNNPHFTTYPDL
jgi:ligand-binding sensor domain-containing protein